MFDYFTSTEFAVFKTKHRLILTFHFLLGDMRLDEMDRTKLVLDMLNKALVELEAHMRPINFEDT